MDETYSYTYFSIDSNGKIGKSGLESTEEGVFDPDDITKLFGIEPFRKWKKGDIRNKNSDEEDPRAIYGFSSWSAEKSTVEGLDAGKQCLDTIKNLKDKIPELMKIKSLYDVTFNIIIVPYIYNEQAPYISLGKEIIEFCYLTGTEIDVDMYFNQEK